MLYVLYPLIRALVSVLSCRKVADVEIAASSKIQALERQLQERGTSTDSKNPPLQQGNAQNPSSGSTPQQQQLQQQRILKLENFAQKSYEEIQGLQGMMR